MADKKKGKTLFAVKDEGRTADGKTGIYSAKVGGYDIGTVTASNKTAGRKKLAAIARKLIK